MVFKRFSVAVFIRTVFICLSAFVLIYILTKTSFIATPFIVAILIIAQIYSMVYYVQKTNRDIARFFESIKYSDFSQSFQSSVRGSSFEELNGAFSEVIEEFRKARAEKEEQYRYLQIVVQHVGIGLLAFTQNGSVELMNTAAKKLLKVHALNSITELSRISPSLVAALREIKSGEKVLVKIMAENELSQLSIYATEFKLKESHYTLVSLTNIQSELEEREMEAWQNLIRVLTHEIMNSVTPIVSLSSTASSLLETAMNPERSLDGEQNQGSRSESPKQPDGENLRDVKGALDTISKRSEGLLHFVDDYRNLTRIPTPNFQRMKLIDLFGRIERLFSDRFHLRKIWYTYSSEPPNLELTADPDLIEQVLINMVLNSISALSSTPSPMIKLSGKIDERGATLIQVMDNGKGIPEDLQEKVFIPFFTTHKEGSGIGLSISRQIMRAHKGGIAVQSTPGKETIFTLRF
jgi:nitrogen fixation/metabolism regulation signal transduction histidine kinase